MQRQCTCKVAEARPAHGGRTLEGHPTARSATHAADYVGLRHPAVSVRLVSGHLGHLGHRREHPSGTTSCPCCNMAVCLPWSAPSRGSKTLFGGAAAPGAGSARECLLQAELVLLHHVNRPVDTPVCSLSGARDAALGCFQAAFRPPSGPRPAGRRLVVPRMPPLETRGGPTGHNRKTGKSAAITKTENPAGAHTAICRSGHGKDGSCRRRASTLISLGLVCTGPKTALCADGTPSRSRPVHRQMSRPAEEQAQSGWEVASWAE